MQACVFTVLVVPFALFGCGGKPTPSPSPPSPSPPTPSPPSPHPPGPPCTATELENVLEYEKGDTYLQCVPNCISGTRINESCVSLCLQKTDCSPICADCVVDFCLDYAPQCTKCYSGLLPTPDPTPTPPPSGRPCNDDEWKTVNDLTHNTEYQNCDLKLHCWSGVGVPNKNCILTCLQVVGVGSNCAHCVVDHCYGGDCAVCNSGATPEPTQTPCAEYERTIVDTRSTNEKYEACEFQLHCWNDFILDKHCAQTCLQTVGCSKTCAQCVANTCMNGQHCYACFPPVKPTPPPTPGGQDCSDQDWQIVGGLSSNKEYVDCDNVNHCWNGFKYINKTCVSSCMQKVGCSKKCAECVVDYGATSACYSKPTPAPSPSEQTLCTSVEQTIVFNLTTNTNYDACILKKGCVSEYGTVVDKQCLSVCLQEVGCSIACADCVTYLCPDTPTCRSCVGEWPTPEPTSTPIPTISPCNAKEWAIVSDLSHNALFLSCTEQLKCTNKFGRIDPSCLKTCLQRVNCSSQCATCLADHSPHGSWAECYDGATPSPTHPTDAPCTLTEWTIVESLDTNEKYVNCDTEHQCLKWSGMMNKACVMSCMEAAGCSKVCAQCVVDVCFEGNCDACRSSPTPTPPPGLLFCSRVEWEIILDVNEDQKYLLCIERLGCWKDIGELNPECWQTCIQLVGASSGCATCVAKKCLQGTREQCHTCHGDITPTPAPTSPPTYSTPPCSTGDWAIFQNLVRNTNYTGCVEIWHCYKGEGLFDNGCVENCMETVGCSHDCAVCVVEHCTSTDCTLTPTCYDPALTTIG